MEPFSFFEAFCAFCVGYTIGDIIIVGIIKRLFK